MHRLLLFLRPNTCIWVTADTAYRYEYLIIAIISMVLLSIYVGHGFYPFFLYIYFSHCKMA